MSVRQQSKYELVAALHGRGRAVDQLAPLRERSGDWDAAAGGEADEVKKRGNASGPVTRRFEAIPRHWACITRGV